MEREEGHVQNPGDRSILGVIKVLYMVLFILFGWLFLKKESSIFLKISPSYFRTCALTSNFNFLKNRERF